MFLLCVTIILMFLILSLDLNDKKGNTKNQENDNA